MPFFIGIDDIPLSFVALNRNAMLLEWMTVAFYYGRRFRGACLLRVSSPLMT
jgi:hypothetical protein